MSSYRTYYDYRKNYAYNSPSTTTLSKKDAPTTNDKTELASKFTTPAPTYSRFLPSKTNTDRKVPVNKYGTSFSPSSSTYSSTHTSRSTEPSTPLISSRSSSRARSRDPSPITIPKTEKSSASSTYTPYRTYSGRLSTSKDSNTNTNTNSVAARRTSRDESNRGPPVTKYNLGNLTASSRRNSREDLTTVGLTSSSKLSSSSRASSREDLSKIGTKYGSKEDLSKLGKYTANSTSNSSKSNLSKYGTSAKIGSIEDLRYGTSKYGSSSTENKYGSSLSGTSLSRRNSREDISRASSTSRYGSSLLASSRRGSREDLSITPSKYVSPNVTRYTSLNRTLSGNSSEPRSRTSSISIDDSSRRSLSTSRSSLKSVTPDKEIEQETNDNSKPVQTVTVKVCTRGTSPNPPSSSSYLRMKRSEMARQIEKEIQRPVLRSPMVDKEVQSDRMDDTARYSRFGSTVITPWNSYLDTKYSSPGYAKYSRLGGFSVSTSKSSDSDSKKSDASSKKSDTASKISDTTSKISTTPSRISDTTSKISTTPSRTSGTASRISDSTSKLSSSSKPSDTTSKLSDTTPKKSDSENKKLFVDIKKSSSNLKLPEQESKTSDSLSKSLSTTSKANKNERSISASSSQNTLPPKCALNKTPPSSLSSPQKTLESVNKDFRKSTLNMNPNFVKSTKSPSKSSSSSDTDSVVSITSSKKTSDKKLASSGSDTTVSESLRSKSNMSTSTKNSKKESETKIIRCRSRSGSSESTSSSNSTLSENKKNDSSISDAKSISKSNSRTSIGISDLAQDSFQTNLKSNASNKDNLMKNTSQSSEPNSIDAKQNIKSESESSKPKFKIRPIESGERAWWLNSDEKPDSPKIEPNSKENTNNSYKEEKYKIRPIESGERAWWLNSDEKSSSTIDSKNKEIKNNSYEQEKFKIRPIESGERAWWLKSNSDITTSNKTDSKSSSLAKQNNNNGSNSNIKNASFNNKSNSVKSDELKSQTNGSKSNLQKIEEKTTDNGFLKPPSIIHQISGEKAWWMMSNKNVPDGVICYSTSEDSSSESEEELNNYVVGSDKNKETHTPPIEDRLSPDGIESTKVPEEGFSKRHGVQTNKFISTHTNIDDILDANLIIKKQPRCDGEGTNKYQLDDCALQLYKDGDYGAYLDLESSIGEQQEEFEGFQDNRKNSIILRTQLSVRVHTIIEKLLNSEDRDLRNSLFSLKQIFQEDKDLVHEFVQNDGLSCLIKVGSKVDHKYQNYILRALGQLMLYVDGMNGVINHNRTVQWLYTLITSKFRLVVKTALKLLLVFVEYVETNCLLLIQAVSAVDIANGLPLWSIIMRLLKDYDANDTELLIYAMTLINKCLNGIPDQDTYYDQVDALEEQGMEGIIQRYMSRQGTDLDLLRQFQIYEAVLEHEDSEQKESPLSRLDETIRKTLRNRKSLQISCERRKSRRHSTGTNAFVSKQNSMRSAVGFQENSDGEGESSSSQSSHGRADEMLNGKYNNEKDVNHVGVTPALRKRRERAERQRSFIREQQENGAAFAIGLNGNKIPTELQHNGSNSSFVTRQSPTRINLSPQLSCDNNAEDYSETNMLNGNAIKKPWMLKIHSKSNDENCPPPSENDVEVYDNNSNQFLQLNKENSVKDLTQKLSSQNIFHNTDENRSVNRIGDMSGLIFKAKEGLAKSKSKIDVLRSPTNETIPKFVVNEIKKTESELHWEELVENLNRPLNLCDLDFTDLQSDDEADILAPIGINQTGPPPPPPPGGMGPPPLGPPNCPKPPLFGLNAINSRGMPMKTENVLTNKNNATEQSKKSKKTVKLFWKEVREDPLTNMRLQNDGCKMIWDELSPVQIDTQKLEHLFESRAKDLMTKKQQELNKNKEIIVLDHKRSNAINIGMTKLPPPQSIKTAILKMDATIMNREGIEKLLTMLPTEEERTRIQDAQTANPDLPLGSAEQFLLTLASISELSARLKLWAFKLDFECSEREIAEPLMDLKQGIELLKVNKTFRVILGTLLSIGIFLNGSDVKGFQIDYLIKVPEVKDTVHKHSLLHHLCFIVMEKFPDSTDLYSEIGAIIRVSKVDFDELKHNIQRLETDCKASWDHLKIIAKHDRTTIKVKMSDFLADCAERIILLSTIHRRVINRFRKFLMWLGVPLHQIPDTKPNEFCRIISEFSLEYRTTRERVLQQLEKKASHRERNKTRGKMITEVGKFNTKEDRADAELRHVLGTSDVSDMEGGGTLPWRRRLRDQNSRSSLGITLNGTGAGDLTDADDEILESLVKTATKAPASRTAPRERKRTRHVDRKSIKRSRTRDSMLSGSKESP